MTTSSSSSHYTQYVSYHVGLLNDFKGQAGIYPPFIDAEYTHAEDIDEGHQAFVDTLEKLCQITHYTDTASEQGQWLVSRIVSSYSHLMPLLPRDLLWFFGGDCLHYMPDEEILFYQQLDELRFAAEEGGKAFDYPAAKASLAKSH